MPPQTLPARSETAPPPPAVTAPAGDEDYLPEADGMEYARPSMYQYSGLQCWYLNEKRPLSRALARRCYLRGGMCSVRLILTLHYRHCKTSSEESSWND